MRLLAILAVSLSLVACAQQTPEAGSPVLPAPAEDKAKLDQLAKEALARWDAAVAANKGKPSFVPVGELTDQIGNWEDAVGGNNKMALSAGALVDKAGLSESAPADARVQWADGKSLEVPVMSAAQTLRSMQTGRSCDGCKPLEVVDARLSTKELATSRGKATVPVWEYVLSGTRVIVTRVAVSPTAGITVTPPPWDPNNAPGGLSVESATASPDGKKLTAAFIGSQGPASEPCGTDYSAYAVESANAVVIVILSTPFAGTMGANFACTAMGYPRTADATLAAPLGDRSVLEVRQGLPIPVTIASAGK